MRHLDKIALLFLTLAVVIIARGLNRIETNTEDVMAWLPDDSAARDASGLFDDHFGSDDFVVLSWQGCTSEDPRLPKLARRLRKSDAAVWIERVVTGPEVLARLQSELREDAGAVRDSLRGIFFGLESPEKTCLVVELNSEGTANRGAFMDSLWVVVDEMETLGREMIAIGGYPYLANYFDRQIKQSFLSMLVPSIVVATVVALICLRSVVLTGMVFVTAGLAAATSVAFVPLCGAKFGGLSSIIPTLTFVLTLSGCLHLIRYHIEAGGDRVQLLRIGWKPCCISASTTAIGMLSLMRSHFPAIRDFGFYCAAGVLFSLAFQLLVMPWLLGRWWVPRERKSVALQGSDGVWGGIISATQRWRWAGNLLAAALVGSACWGLTILEARVEVDGFFAADSPVLRDIGRLERELGPLDQTEAVVIFTDAVAENFPERFGYVRRLQRSWLRLAEIDVAHSLVNYLPSEPTRLIQKSVFRSKLRARRKSLANGIFLAVQGEREMWRISLRFPFTRKSNFTTMAGSVSEVAASQAREYLAADHEFQTPEFLLSGKTFLFHHAQETLLKDLFKNFLLAFVVITPLLMIVLRSVGLGVVGMIPNVMPALLVFGCLGLLGQPVDLAVAMTASVALGIAVDDTSHFLIRFRDLGGRLQESTSVLVRAMQQCGPAMTQTTVISCASLGCAYFSDLYVMSRFAISIAVLLVIALLADVLVLPCVLHLFGRPRAEFGDKNPETLEGDSR